MTKAKKSPAPTPAKKSHHRKVSPPEVDSRPVAAFPDRSRSLPSTDKKPVAGLVSVQERMRSIQPAPVPTGNNQPQQLTPVLTLHEVSGTHVLRIYDQANINLVLGVAQLVKGGSLVVVTPTDTKAFDLGPGSSNVSSGLPRPRPQPIHARSTQLDQAGPGEGEGEETDVEISDNGDVIDPSDPMAETMRLARQQEEDEIAAGLRPARSASGSPKKRESRNDVHPNSACGRCQGTGQTVGGGRCPVCQGSGVIHRYGSSPTPRR